MAETDDLLTKVRDMRKNYELQRIRLDQQVTVGRVLAHRIRNNLAIVVGFVELVGASTGCSADVREHIPSTLASLEGIVEDMEHLHIMIRALSVATFGDEARASARGQT